jgi:hypothetical protein
MKVSLWIPKGTEKVKSQLQSELPTAMKIIDEYKRTDVVNALKKLIARTGDEPYQHGVIFYSDGHVVISQRYDGKVKLFRVDIKYMLPEDTQ